MICAKKSRRSGDEGYEGGGRDLSKLFSGLLGSSLPGFLDTDLLGNLGLSGLGRMGSLGLGSSGLSGLGGSGLLSVGLLGDLGLGGRSGDMSVGILSDVSEASVVDQRLSGRVGRGVSLLGGVGLLGSLNDPLGCNALLGSL